jgi:hypothetical protein
MRKPRTFEVLKYSGPALGGGVLALLAIYAALAQVHEPIKEWGKAQFSGWLPLMTSFWFVALIALLVVGYVCALVFCGTGAPKAVAAPPTHPPPPLVDLSRKVEVGRDNLGVIDLSTHLHEAPPPFRLTDEFLAKALISIKAKTGGATNIDYSSVASTPEQRLMAERFAGFLEENGFVIGKRLRHGPGSTLGAPTKPIGFLFWGTSTMVVFDPT